MSYLKKTLSSFLITLLLMLTIGSNINTISAENASRPLYCSEAWGRCIQDTNNYLVLIPIAGQAWFGGTLIGCSIGYLNC